MKVFTVLFLTIILCSAAYCGEPGSETKPVIIESPVPAHRSETKQAKVVKVYNSTEPSQSTEIQAKPGTVIRNEINITFPRKAQVAPQPLSIQSTPNLENQVAPPMPPPVHMVSYNEPHKRTSLEKLGHGIYSVATCWTPFFEENTKVVEEASLENAGDALETSGEVVRANVSAPVKIVEKASTGVVDIATFWLP